MNSVEKEENPDRFQDQEEEEEEVWEDLEEDEGDDMLVYLQRQYDELHEREGAQQKRELNAMRHREQVKARNATYKERKRKEKDEEEVAKLLEEIRKP